MARILGMCPLAFTSHMRTSPTVLKKLSANVPRHFARFLDYRARLVLVLREIENNRRRSDLGQVSRH
jgi:hypothetical protein